MSLISVSYTHLIILDVEKSALTLVYGKDGKPCEIDCQTKAFEYKQEPTNPAFRCV